MKVEKKFDCVEMKAEIQARLLREVAELGEEEAQKRRAERLSREKVPRYVLVVDGFPQTSSGKVPKNILRSIAIGQLGLDQAGRPVTDPERAAS